MAGKKQGGKVEMLELSRIKNRFDVRTKLDDDRVLQLAGCYESGMELPPIEVIRLDEGGDPDYAMYAYVDGRHRGAAREFCNFADIAAIVVENPNDPAELFARALEANYGGAKPPTRDDISHTITRMLELGASQTSIRERLTFIPLGSLKAYISSARGAIMKRRIAKSLDLVGEGSTVKEAAEKFKVPVDTLKEVLAGKKGKWGASRSSEKEFAISLKAYISQELRSSNSGIAKKMDFMFKKVEDGEMSYREAYGVLQAWAEHLRKTGVRVADWRARLNAISGEIEKTGNESVLEKSA